MKKLKWYIAEKDYVKYLKSFDNKVENIDYKSTIKPYIGIILKIGEFNYYVPVSSPKKKHIKMKESLDFIKIIDKKGIILGVLNLNNMIPILDSQIKVLKYAEIDKERDFKSTKEKRQYISLLTTELKMINLRIEKIQNNALKLYEIKDNNPNSNLAKRSCNFKLLEQKAIRYMKG